MRFQKLYVIIAPLAAALASCGCQSSHHQAPLLSAKQSTPPTIASATPAPTAETQTPAAKPVPGPAASSNAAPPSADPVADLIAKVEKEYSTGQDNYKA